MQYYFFTTTAAAPQLCMNVFVCACFAPLIDSLFLRFATLLLPRRDMLDEALLRPGRLEVQIEIGLPDQYGRHQILKIHTNKVIYSEAIHRIWTRAPFCDTGKCFKWALCCFLPFFLGYAGLVLYFLLHISGCQERVGTYCENAITTNKWSSTNPERSILWRNCSLCARRCYKTRSLHVTWPWKNFRKWPRTSAVLRLRAWWRMQWHTPWTDRWEPLSSALGTWCGVVYVLLQLSSCAFWRLVWCAVFLQKWATGMFLCFLAAR